MVTVLNRSIGCTATSHSRRRWVKCCMVGMLKRRPFHIKATCHLEQTIRRTAESASKDFASRGKDEPCSED